MNRMRFHLPVPHWHILRNWFKKHHVTQNFINDLLSVLSKHGHRNLPLEARTLMKTPRYHKKEAYNHFLSLPISIRLICLKNLSPNYIEYAQYFVKHEI